MHHSCLIVFLICLWYFLANNLYIDVKNCFKKIALSQIQINVWQVLFSIIRKQISQLTYNLSKSAIETLEKGVKYV